MRMRAWPGRTYRFLKVPPLFPFGFGMSYTDFRYSNLEVVESQQQQQQQHTDIGRRRSQWTVTVHCHNNGSVTSDEVLLLFVAFEDADTDSSSVPMRELRSFRRLRNVKPGEVCGAARYAAIPWYSRTLALVLFERVCVLRKGLFGQTMLYTSIITGTRPPHRFDQRCSP